MIYPDWPAPENVKAVTTTRQEGGSKRPYNSFNLADHVGDAAQAVQQNRNCLRQRLKLPAAPVWLDQVHGDTVVNVGQCGERPSADAGISTRTGQVCAVLTADCLPVLMCDREGTRVAAAHAGWRGLAAGILERSIEALNTEPVRLMVWLGPAIGPAAFEVGDEVRQVFVDQHAQAAVAFSAATDGHWLADLYRLAAIRLQAVGVDAIYGGGFCTFSDRERFYSYRRDGATGRMASLIWLGEP
ncbi:MAG: purine nucleoside phosphorylase YfiH [Gammaproteobacteria bacterium]|nr:MAG: purine nucleoside phosphorylase YfiH [Gammaproteobacteria bacterium]